MMERMELMVLQDQGDLMEIPDLMDTKDHKVILRSLYFIGP